MPSATQTRAARREQPQSQKRVAIYCRQSVDRSDEVEYGSIQAQREAVEAFVRSQQSEGWICLPDRYDDLGFSGGNTNRPAFQRLLAEVQAGNVDVVGVYKFDRLARNQIDLLQTIQYLEEHGVAFVSVTQHLDTTTSVGRCMLGMLGSFGQLERDCIAERTRDKVQAARRKGFWTGGRPVLGYDIADKRLVVNAEEAQQVKAIFALYLELGSLLPVVDELNSRAWRNKRWRNKRGEMSGGNPFDKGSLYTMLRNPIYLGRVRAGDELVPGVHEAIIDEETFAAVGVQLETNGTGRRPMRFASGNQHGALLKGIARCSCGSALTFHYTKKGNRRYGYYVCVRHNKRGAKACPGSRTSVGDLDAHVLHHVRAVGRDPALFEATLAADRAAREAKKPELVAEVRRHQVRKDRLERERDGLLETLPAGGSAAQVLRGRLTEIGAELDVIEERGIELRGELVSLESKDIDPEELRPALEAMEPIWDELGPRERARVLELLLEEVVFYGQEGEVDVVFRAGGPRPILAEVKP